MVVALAGSGFAGNSSEVLFELIEAITEFEPVVVDVNDKESKEFKFLRYFKSKI